MRRTRIVATLGPATDALDVLEGLLCAGVDVVRLNAAHSDAPALERRLLAVRATAEKLGRHVGVLLDLPGPKIRVGEMAPSTVLTAGATFTLGAERCVGNAVHACITYAGLASDVKPGDRILVDDGRVELEVVGADPGAGRVETRVTVGGPLSSNKGVNVPGVTLNVSPITDVDRICAAWACEHAVDFIGQSFVRSARDVAALRALLTCDIPIVAKIEKHEAVPVLEEIIAEADAVMVARGDLGVETAPETVPVVQRQVLALARSAGKPVIVATQMLDSMTHAPRPTRAEASDVANAIFNRADAVMLSGETAVGDDPPLVVRTMGRIAKTAEEAIGNDGRDEHEPTTDIQAAVSSAVCDLAYDLGLAAIVPVTESGATARAVARHRPPTRIVAITPSDAVARRLGIVWGVRAVVSEFPSDTDELLDAVCNRLAADGPVRRGDKIAMTAGRAQRTAGKTDFILVREV